VPRGLSEAPNEERIRGGIRLPHSNAVWKSAEDAGAFIHAPGTYRVPYENGPASSNTITVVVSRPAANFVAGDADPFPPGGATVDASFEAEQHQLHLGRADSPVC